MGVVCACVCVGGARGGAAGGLPVRHDGRRRQRRPGALGRRRRHRSAGEPPPPPPPLPPSLPPPTSSESLLLRDCAPSTLVPRARSPSCRVPLRSSAAAGAGPVSVETGHDARAPRARLRRRQGSTDAARAAADIVLTGEWLRCAAPRPRQCGHDPDSKGGGFADRYHVALTRGRPASVP